jgi:magnesium-transporting ATPase (P-type)
MTPVQILWINMITAVTLGVALAFEPGNPEVMSRSPRASREPLLTPLVIWRTVFVSVLMLAAISWVFTVEAAEQGTEYARTVAVNMLVVFEAVYLISTRHLDRPSFVLGALTGNRMVLWSIGAVAVLQVLFTYTEPFQQLFASRPLDLSSWYQIGVMGLILFVVVELEKLVRRRLRGFSVK